MKQAKAALVVIILIFCKLKIINSRTCDFDKFPFESIKTNCTRDEFLPLCSNLNLSCRHVSDKLLTAHYGQSRLSCTFPRILAGENGFVDCLGFNFTYPCPKSQMLQATRASVCDRQSCDDCLSGSDNGFGPGFKCLKDGVYCGLPQLFLYDNVPDCLNGEDLCFREKSYSTLHDSCARCGDGSIIPRRAWCDGIIDCSDLSDECLCPNRLSICRKVVTYLQSSASCAFGEIGCGNQTCITRSDICDGKINCADGSDERNHFCGATLECEESSNGTDCRCPLTCGNSNDTCNEDPAFCCSEYEDCGLRLATRCDGRVECSLTLEDEQNCTDYILCRGFNQKMISIPMRKRCDFVVDCVGGVDELNCDDQRFYCISNNNTYVRSNQVRNGRVDCEDGSDECVEDENNTNSYFFHSQRTLIKNKILYVLVWVMALLALLGNTAVIFGQIRALVRNYHRIDDLASLRANHIFVLNLAVADLLMGIYLLAVGIAYEVLRGSYCIEELSWRGSSVCTWMGITALISIEASVLTLVVLTSCRLYTIVKPFKTSSYPKTWSVLLSVILIWALSLVVATLPVTDAFHSYFPDHVLLPDNPFVDRPVVSLEEGRTFLLQSLVYYPVPNHTKIPRLVEEIRSAHTWDSLAVIFNNLPQQKMQLRVAARFGYYNVHSICLADIFPRWDDPYVALSLSLIIFNFLAFFYIASVYIAVHYITFKNKSSSADHSDAARLQRKIFWIIATNFVTWIPICILSFLRVGGSTITGEVYQVAAIILLPINSSINPLLYSSILRNIFRKLRGSSNRISRKPGRFGSVDTMSATKSTADNL